jgi:hypothetical protein
LLLWCGHITVANTPSVVNSWGLGWGVNGTFRIAYGAANIMPPDNTFALQFGPTSNTAKLSEARLALAQGTTQPEGADCVWYQPKASMRLLKLHDLLTTLANAVVAAPNSAEILGDILAANLGTLRGDLAAPQQNMRVCGRAKDVLLTAVGNLQDPQLEALLRIKASIDTTDMLQTWSRASGANGGYCNWTGVQCGSGRSVQSININDTVVASGLQGTLPPAAAFSGLDNLTSIVFINQASIGGTLPADWSVLQQLQVIQLYSLTDKDIRGSLTGPLPSPWGSLARLRELVLNFNDLSGTIPESFASLGALEMLSLYNNRLDGSIPTLPQRLQVLDLDNNQLSGRMPDSMTNLTRLRSMYLASNQLTGPIPDSLKSLTRLETLELSANQITGPLPSWFSNMRSLMQLRLLGNRLTGTLPESWSSLRSLWTMLLGNNRLTGTLPDSYKALTGLTSLALGGNDLTGTVPASWSSMSRLWELYLWGNPGLSGCLPASFQKHLGQSFSLENHVQAGTSITGFC